MKERSLWGPALVLAPMAIAAVWVATSHLEGSPPWLLIATFGTLAVVVADWPHWVAAKVVWSNTATIAIAGSVLAPPGAAPTTAVAVMMVTAIYAPERRSFVLSRFLTNAGLLAIDGLAIGLAIEALGPTPIPVSGRLVLAISVAMAASAAVAVVSLPTITAYRFGRSVVKDHLAVAIRLPLQEIPLAMAAGLVSATVVVRGPGWIPVALACAISALSLPVARARLAACRTDLITTVTEALDARGLASDPHARMEALALRAGRYLRFSEDQLQQLRYVCLTYAMTDLFVNEVARPIDVPDHGRQLASRASRVLFYGLALDDVADAIVNRLGDAVANLDALMFPEENDGPLTAADALEELLRLDFEPEIVHAIEVAASDREGGLRAPAAQPLGFGFRSSSGSG